MTAPNSTSPAPPLKLDPTRIIPAVIRNDLRGQDVDTDVDAYLLDMERSIVRHSYCLSYRSPGSKWQWLRYCRAIKMTEQLKEELKTRQHLLVRIPSVWKDDFHTVVAQFLDSKWDERDAVRERVKELFYQQRPLSVGGWLELEEVKELAGRTDDGRSVIEQKLLAYESTWVAAYVSSKVEEALSNRYHVRWESDPSPVLNRDQLRKDYDRIYDIIESEWELVGSEMVADLKKTLQVGDVREAVISGVDKYGAAVIVEVLEGFLRKNEMSSRPISHPREVCTVGDRVRVKILDINWFMWDVSVGLKQLEPSPWERVETRYPVGKQFRGRVISTVNYGAFVELEPGIEGLIRIQDMLMPDGKTRHPSKIVSIGEEIEVTVLEVEPHPSEENPHEKKILLGMRPVEPT